MHGFTMGTTHFGMHSINSINLFTTTDTTTHGFLYTRIEALISDSNRYENSYTGNAHVYHAYIDTQQ